jgi:copper chaperone CopZ
MYTTTISSLVVSVAALSLLGGCASTGSQTSDQRGKGEVASAESDSELQPIAADGATLVVKGLSCPLCATNVDKQLLAVRGVSDVRVDLGSGEVKLAFSPIEQHPSRADLRRAIVDSGYTLVEIRTN